MTSTGVNPNNTRAVSDERVLTQSIKYFPQLRLITGSVRGAVFLSVAIQCTARAKEPIPEWFTKSPDEWTAETGLTPAEQSTCRKGLAKAGFFRERYAGTPRRLYYHADFNAIKTALTNAATTGAVVDESEIKPPPAAKGKRPAPDDTKDTRHKHPAIVAMKRVMGHFPVKPLWDAIIKELGEEPDYKLLSECALAWTTRGKQIGNLSIWFFTWYRNGGIDNSNGRLGSDIGHGGQRPYQTAGDRNESRLRERDYGATHARLKKERR